jgi:hypothetical protein
MADPLSTDSLARTLKRRGVALNTLHAVFSTAIWDRSRRSYIARREEYALKLVVELGGIRAPDLQVILKLTQPTSWRVIKALVVSKQIRVVANYQDHVNGRPARWLQPTGTPRLSEDRRRELIETAELILQYQPLWEAERIRAAATTTPEPPVIGAESQPELPTTQDVAPLPIRHIASAAPEVTAPELTNSARIPHTSPANSSVEVRPVQLPPPLQLIPGAESPPVFRVAESEVVPSIVPLANGISDESAASFPWTGWRLVIASVLCVDLGLVLVGYIGPRGTLAVFGVLAVAWLVYSESDAGEWTRYDQTWRYGSFEHAFRRRQIGQAICWLVLIVAVVGTVLWDRISDLLRAIVP